MAQAESYRIAVIIPCYNEALAIGQVITDFRKALPTADIYIFDNNSTDDTVRIAVEQGATVRQVALQGKGNVVHRMFADVQADIYIMADGDATYDAASAPALVERLLEDHLDIVVGTRVADESAFPPGHRFGNWLFNKIVTHLFGVGLKDIFSGYRVMSHRFVKSFPAESAGFNTETEMSIHILEMRIPYAEVPTPYYTRPEGSVSKLNTYRDGFLILMTILSVFRHVRPLIFFGGLAALLFIAMVVLGIPVILHFMEYGTVPRLPTAILATGLGIMSGISLTCGLILSGVARVIREAKRMRYLMFTSLTSRSG